MTRRSLMAGAVLATAMALLGCRATASRGARAGGGDRIVSLHDVTTEIVVELGAADRLVGVADPIDVTSDLGAAIAGVARVGGLETVLAVRPDLVLGLAIVRERAPELVRGLERGGTSAYFPTLARVEDVESMVREIGRRLGVGQAADRLAERLRVETSTRAERGSPRVFVYDCCDPPFTAARATVLSDLIERQGGRNVFADLDAGWTHVAWEEVVARKPEVIVVDAYEDGPRSDVDTKLRTLRAVEGLGGLPVAIIPLRDTLGGLGIVHGAGILREAFGGRT